MPFDNDGFDAFKDHRELSGTDEDDLFAIGGERHGNAKSTGFKSLVPKSIAVPIPIENLESVGCAIDENEERTIEGILVERVLDDGSKTIERFSHIDGSGCNVNGVGQTV